MKPALLFTGVALLALVTTACRSRYELTLSNTSIIDAYSRPKLDNGYYVFKDAKGEEVKIFAGKVREINRR
jgi:hypothetical protein